MKVDYTSPERYADRVDLRFDPHRINNDDAPVRQIVVFSVSRLATHRPSVIRSR